MAAGNEINRAWGGKAVTDIQLELGKRAIKRFLRQSRSWGRVFYDIRFHLANLRGREPIIVYQMGKVGSSTIVASLKALKLRRPIYHVHTLTQEGIAHGEATYGDSVQLDLSRSKHLFMSRHLHKHLGKSANGKKWKVVTLVREPIARNISSFFQIIELLMPDFHERYQHRSIEINELTALFLEQYSTDNRFVNWFDLELKSVFGIDVFASNFSTVKGYKIYRSERAEVLLLRLENISECAQEAFREFLGVEQFRLVEKNISSKKDYYAAYKWFTEMVILPEDYINTIYALKYAQHFYSAEEINAFKAKWTRTREVHESSANTLQ